MRILSYSAKFSAGQPYVQHIIFRPQWPLPIALIVWGCGLPENFLAIENMTLLFSAHVYYDKTAGWIRIPLGTEIGLAKVTLC